MGLQLFQERELTKDALFFEDITEDLQIRLLLHLHVLKKGERRYLLPILHNIKKDLKHTDEKENLLMKKTRAVLIKLIDLWAVIHAIMMTNDPQALMKELYEKFPDNESLEDDEQLSVLSMKIKIMLSAILLKTKSRPNFEEVKQAQLQISETIIYYLTILAKDVKKERESMKLLKMIEDANATKEYDPQSFLITHFLQKITNENLISLLRLGDKRTNFASIVKDALSQINAFGPEVRQEPVDKPPASQSENSEDTSDEDFDDNTPGPSSALAKAKKNVLKIIHITTSKLGVLKTAIAKFPEQEYYQPSTSTSEHDWSKEVLIESSFNDVCTKLELLKTAITQFLEIQDLPHHPSVPSQTSRKTVSAQELLINFSSSGEDSEGLIHKVTEQEQEDVEPEDLEPEDAEPEVAQQEVPAVEPIVDNGGGGDVPVVLL